MEAKITVDVENYRPSYAGRECNFKLQSPISPERRPGSEILVRQDGGGLINEVTFRDPEELVRLDDGTDSTYAHGILRRSDPTHGHRKGDQIWLTASAATAGGIPAVNLRTWEPISVAAHDVCWIPKYRKRDRDEEHEELLTISGPTVSGMRRYVLAVVQRLRCRDHIVNVESVDLRDIVEQEIWGYQNLTASEDGKMMIGKFCRQSLDSMRPDAFSDNDTDDEIEDQSSSGGRTETGSSRAADSTPASSIIPEGASLGITINFDSYVDRRHQELERKVMADLANERQFVLGDPKDARSCNLGRHCPTLPSIFCHGNTPSLENLFPKHHHRGDDECRGGSRHGLHCVYQFREDRNGREFLDRTSCVLPPTINHMCCDTNARPANKSFTRPCLTEDIGGAKVTRKGRREITVVELEDDYSDLPFEVEEMPYVPERDLDGLGKNTPEYRDRVAQAEMAAQWINAHCGSGGCHDGETQEQLVLPFCGLDVPGPSSCASFVNPWDVQAVGSASRPIEVDDEDEDEEMNDEEMNFEEGETPDVFGDRHFQDDEEMDIDE